MSFNRFRLNQFPQTDLDTYRKQLELFSINKTNYDLINIDTSISYIIDELTSHINYIIEFPKEIDNCSKSNFEYSDKSEIVKIRLDRKANKVTYLIHKYGHNWDEGNYELQLLSTSKIECDCIFESDTIPVTNKKWLSVNYPVLMQKNKSDKSKSLRLIRDENKEELELKFENEFTSILGMKVKNKNIGVAILLLIIYLYISMLSHLRKI